MKSSMFKPTFGNRPEKIVGREFVVDEFAEGLSYAPGHPARATVLIGQRGIGKTALLLELAEKAERMNFIAVRVTASERMLDEILQLIQIGGAKHIHDGKMDVKSVNAGALGFSFGLTFSKETSENYGFRIKLTLLAEKLAKQGKGIAFFIDEIQSSVPEMRELATTYQHLIGEGGNVAIMMAGLPHAVSSVLNDDVLAFLNRSRKIYLGPIALPDIKSYYMECFHKLKLDFSATSIENAVSATKGHPYLMQLIGYYIVKYSENAKKITDETVSSAILSAEQDLIEGIHKPCLNALSDQDITFLKAIAKDKGSSKVADIQKRLGVSQGYLQQYRKRLIDAGVIASEKRGHLEIIIPFLADYLNESL